MKKLMKLLNEYQKELNDKEENNYEIFERKLNGDSIRMNDLDDPYEWLNIYWWYAKARLISKQFWFIKRLVYNDKIDHEKIKSWELNWCKWFFETVQPEYFVIMLLAISDNPIEDLCVYLKDDATEKIDKLLDGAKRTCENIWI